MPKKSNNKPRREMTKRQMSHWQRESRLQRFIFISGIIVVIAVLAVVGTGVYINQYRPYQSTVIKIDKASFSMDYYINLLAFFGMVNGNPQYIQYFTDPAVQLIEQDYVYTQQAKQLGITVSDDEVKAEIKKQSAPSNQAVFDAIRGNLLQNKLKDFYDKDTNNPDKVPTSADSKNVQAMFLESQGQVNDIETRIQKGEKFSNIASQLSLESISKDKSGDFGWIPQGVLAVSIGGSGDKILEDAVFSKDTPVDTSAQIEDNSISKSVGYWLVEITDAPVTTASPTPSPTAAATPQVHLLGMLLGSQQQGEEIKARLEAGGPGNDFASLAKQYSLYTNAANDGGDLGLKNKGEMPAAVDEVVFPADASKALAKNTVSGPIRDISQKTNGGIWLIQASDKQIHEITPEYRNVLINVKVKDWEDKVWNDYKGSAQNLLTSDQTQFAIKQAQSRIPVR